MYIETLYKVLGGVAIVYVVAVLRVSQDEVDAHRAKNCRVDPNRWTDKNRWEK